MILNALRHTDLPDGTLDPEEIAVRVEEKLFSVSVSPYAFTITLVLHIFLCSKC